MVQLFTARRCERPLRGEFCRREITATTQPQWTSVTVTTSQTNITGNVYVPPVTETYNYDLDGNLTSDGRWTYNWDAENRLTNIVARTTVGPQLYIKFEYDWQGRRIHKQVWTNTSGTGTASVDQKYLYDGWNVIAVLDTANTLKQSFAWGTDLSSSLQGAGGVGGLLWIKDTATISNATSCHFVAYDGNGNIKGLVNAADGTISARYDYGPFGELIRQTGPMSKANPIRFSTKYTDDETDLLYYGYRYYNPSTGRWLSRDPIGESGGVNLYGVSMNSPLNILDVLGLKNYKIGDPTDPPMTFDEDFVYDPNARATIEDRLEWARYGILLSGAEAAAPWLEDACATYRHYRDGSGTDMEINYPKAYKDDSVVKSGVDNEIAAAQADAERLAATAGAHFTMTGEADRIGSPATENWQKAIGQHYIWGSAPVDVSCDTFTMIITIHEKDRYNFNGGAVDIATGLPDNANGRFAVLGWAKSFITNGKVEKKVTWKKGRISSTTTIENPPRR